MHGGAQVRDDFEHAADAAKIASGGDPNKVQSNSVGRDWVKGSLHSRQGSSDEGEAKESADTAEHGSLQQPENPKIKSGFEELYEPGQCGGCCPLCQSRSVSLKFTFLFLMTTDHSSHCQLVLFGDFELQEQLH